MFDVMIGNPPHVLNSQYALTPVVAILIITTISFAGRVDVCCDDRLFIALLNSLRRPFGAILVIIASSLTGCADVCGDDWRLPRVLDALRYHLDDFHVRSVRFHAGDRATHHVRQAELCSEPRHLCPHVLQVPGGSRRAEPLETELPGPRGHRRH